MRKKTLILVGLVIAISTIYFFKNSLEESASIEAGDSPTKTISAVRKSELPKNKYKEAFGKIQLTDEEIAAQPHEVDDSSWLKSVFFHRANVQDENGEVVFYGKVVDQNKEPIEGVRVDASSRQYVESIKEQVEHGGGKVQTKPISLITNDKGLFTISGFRGRNLRFETIEKSGYVSLSNLPSFSYSPSYSVKHEADASSPITFTLWEKGETELLIKKNWRKRIIPNGQKYEFDLKNGKLVENQKDSFKIYVRDDYAASNTTKNYPWSVSVEMGEGGVLETEDSYLYLAPESGYLSSYIWDSKTVSKNWSRDLNKKLYVKGKGGNFYAAITLKVKVFHTNSASVVMDVLLNPNGSRNLEYDPSKKLK